MDDEINNSDIIKLILVGDSGTGKTNIITVGSGLKFEAGTLSTTSCSYIQKKIIKNKKEYKVNLWDTVGQEKYRSLTRIFVKDANIVILVYDITKRETFESLNYWKKIIEDILGDDLTIGVIGNKVDLYLQEEVRKEEGEEYANSIGAKFKVTSAKDNPIEICEFIELMLDEYLKKIKNKKPSSRRETLTIKKQVKEKKEEGGCCK